MYGRNFPTWRRLLWLAVNIHSDVSITPRLLVCERHLVPTRTWPPGFRTPPYSSHLLVFARLYIPTVHTPSGVHALPFSWCTHASGLLRLLVFACLGVCMPCLRFVGIRTPSGVCLPRPPAVTGRRSPGICTSPVFYTPPYVYSPLGDCAPPGVCASVVVAS